MKKLGVCALCDKDSFIENGICEDCESVSVGCPCGGLGVLDMTNPDIAEIVIAAIDDKKVLKEMQRLIKIKLKAAG